MYTKNNKKKKLIYSQPRISEFNITSEDFTSDDQKLILYHRFLEAGKFAMALRSHLGDDPDSITVRKVRTTSLDKYKVLFRNGRCHVMF